MLTDAQLRQLAQAALLARQNAWCPHSGFAVGAAEGGLEGVSGCSEGAAEGSWEGAGDSDASGAALSEGAGDSVGAGERLSLTRAEGSSGVAVGSPLPPQPESRPRDSAPASARGSIRKVWRIVKNSFDW